MSGTSDAAMVVLGASVLNIALLSGEQAITVTSPWGMS